MKKQNRWLFGCMAVAVLLATVPAGATSWVDKTSTWSLGSGFISNSGNDMYWFSGTTVQKYNVGTDSWSALSTTGGEDVYGYGASAEGYNIQGKFYFYNQYPNQVSVFDPNSNAWANITPTDLPSPQGQGSVYDPVDGKLWVFASGAQLDAAAYDPGTQAWSSILPTSGTWTNWTYMQGVNVGNVNYRYSGGQNGPGGGWNESGTDMYLSQYAFPEAGTIPNPNDGGVTQSPHYTLSTAFHAGFSNLNVAALGGKVYLSGVGNGLFLSYDPNTNVWTELESYAGGNGGSQSHSMAETGGLIYVQDGSYYFVYTVLSGDTNGDGVVDVVDLNNVFNHLGLEGSGILGDTDHNGVVDVNDLNNVFNNLGTVTATGGAVPEPATLSLLALGGLALLRRRR